MQKIKFIQSFDNKFGKILSDELISFLTHLVEKFNPKIRHLLAERGVRKQRIQSGELPTFLQHTQSIRERVWRARETPSDLLDRRVEITGPVDRKMIINALNSGANVFMADFEDSNSPTWENVYHGQINLYDAIRRTITFTNEDGKEYKLTDNPAVLMVRPRGFHLKEKHITYRDVPVPGCLIDFGIYFFINAKYLMEHGSGPYFYLPKLQNHREARVWNEVFDYSEDYLKIPRGSIKATVLIEHILAAFEMDEILFELRDHSAGLNCGRWDYIFSFIKTFSHDPKFVMPDRSQVTMQRHFMKSYVDLLIRTCHKRGVHAIGGMAAQIPIKNDEQANTTAIEKVRADKLREVQAGHDGTWIAHPGLFSVAKAAFDEYMKTPNQLSVKKEDVTITQDDLLKVPEGTVTEPGIRINISVGLQYITAWLQGSGSVAINNLMEDAATAEICRTQLWQWLHNKKSLDDGRVFDKDLFNQILQEEVTSLKENQDAQYLELALKLFEEIILSDELADFLTVKAYEYVE